MKKEIRKVLVVNAGSSSLKYELFDMKGEKMLCKGLVERIGISGSHLAYQKSGCKKVVKDVEAPDHAAALKAVVTAVSDPENGVIKSLKEIDLITTDAIIIGNEGHGIPEEISALCDNSVYIPISENTESLNASVAAAVFMWEQSK